MHITSFSSPPPLSQSGSDKEKASTSGLLAFFCYFSGSPPLTLDAYIKGVKNPVEVQNLLR